MRKTFQVIEDPGHAWVEVPLEFLEKLGIMGSISPYSYINPRTDLAYLEEDCDMLVFHQAFREKFHTDPKYNESHQNNTFIRGLPSFSTVKTLA